MPTLIYCDPPEAMPITPGSISVGSTPWNFQLDTISLLENYMFHSCQWFSFLQKVGHITPCMFEANLLQAKKVQRAHNKLQSPKHIEKHYGQP